MNAVDTPLYQTFPVRYLQDFIIEVFEYFKVPRPDAEQAAEVLIYSDLHGIDSHGVARLRTYVDMLSLGKINPKPNIKIIREKYSVASVDGDNGLGLVVGPKANQIAMEKAQQHGSGWVSLGHSNHYGAAGYYVVEALKQDLIGWSMTNSTKLVAPLWGAESMLGTNPIAIAFPGLEEPPIVIDMATSAAAYGKIEIAHRKGAAIPSGWALDNEGFETTDPAQMMAAGALLPLGSDREHGGHKGYCLATMVDILTCVLSGANWGPFAPPFSLGHAAPERSVGKGIGQFFGAMDIEGFIDKTEFKRQIDEWIRTFRQTKPQPNTPGVLIPGDTEREEASIRSIHGVPLIQGVVTNLLEISAKTGIPFKADK